MNRSEKTESLSIFPIVILIILIVFIIPLYVNVFKEKITVSTLYTALEDQQVSLNVSTTFTDLITYYPLNSKDGFFEVYCTVPGSTNFRVINGSNVDVTTGVTLASDKTTPSVIRYKNSSSLTLQFTNSSTTNFLTKIDVIF